jgi:hypothetical protein
MKHVKLFINSLNPIVLKIIYVFVYIVKRKVQTKMTNLKKSLFSILSLIPIFSLTLSGKKLFMDYKPNVHDLQPEIQILKVVKHPNNDEFVKKNVQKNPSIFTFLRCGVQ